LPEGITFDTGTFSTVVLEGGVGSAGEGFDSLADSDFPESNLALFARGTSSSSSELFYKKRGGDSEWRRINYKGKSRHSQVQVIFSSKKA
jgi:hypothetical protein